MKHRLIIALSFLLLGYLAKAQNTKQLSLREAIQLGLQNSKQLRISNAKIDEATAVLHQAKNNMLPDLKAQGGYLWITHPDIKLAPSSGSGGSDTGGSKGQAFPDVDRLGYALVNASVPVFSGLRIHYGIESARYLSQASKLDAEHDRDAVIQNTIDAYNNLFKAGKAVDIVKANLKESHERVMEFTNMEKNGLLAKNDLLRAELQESNTQLALLDAENNLKITNVNMNLLLGLPEETELVVDSLHPLEEDNHNITYWEMTALQNRKDLQAISFRERAAMAGVKVAKGEYFPSLAITGGYIAMTIPNFVTITNAFNAGLGFQYNLGSLWKTGAKVAEAKAQVQQTIAMEELLTDKVRLEINKAYEDYLLSKKKVDVYDKAVEQASENYKIAKNKHDNNLLSTTDLLDAYTANLFAQLNSTFAKADAVVSYEKLLQTAGVLNINTKNNTNN